MFENSGMDAPERAAQRADELAEQGDLERAYAWRATLRAIEELQRERREGEAVN